MQALFDYLGFQKEQNIRLYKQSNNDMAVRIWTGSSFASKIKAENNECGFQNAFSTNGFVFCEVPEACHFFCAGMIFRVWIVSRDCVYQKQPETKKQM